MMTMSRSQLERLKHLESYMTAKWHPTGINSNSLIILERQMFQVVRDSQLTVLIKICFIHLVFSMFGNRHKIKDYDKLQ